MIRHFASIAAALSRAAAMAPQSGRRRATCPESASACCQSGDPTAAWGDMPGRPANSAIASAVGSGVSLADLELAKSYHPDRNPDGAELTANINGARATIVNSPRAMPRDARSAALFERQMRPSSSEGRQRPSMYPSPWRDRCCATGWAAARAPAFPGRRPTAGSVRAGWRGAASKASGIRPARTKSPPSALSQDHDRCWAASISQAIGELRRASGIRERRSLALGLPPPLL